MPRGRSLVLRALSPTLPPLKPSEAALRQVEQALKAREDLLELVLDSIPQPIFWKDRQGRYLGCNQAFATMLGLAAPADIVDHTDDELPYAIADDATYRSARDRLVMAQGVADLHALEPPPFSMATRAGWTVAVYPCTMQGGP